MGGGGGEGRIAGDYLWSPPRKVGGRYLGAFLSGTTPHELDADDVPLDVEVSLPVERHREPMALDPYTPPD